MATSEHPVPLWKKMLFGLYNLYERLFHFVSKEEAELVKNTHFFDDLDEKHFKRILWSLQFIKYPASSRIFNEGEQGDALYIIASGSVRIFTYDEYNNKIFLARLNAGDYFGEQALLEEGIKTRNANIEAINDVTLIKIKERIIITLLKKDPLLRKKLNKAGLKQLLNIITQSTGFYEEIQAAILQEDDPKIEKFRPGELIFNVGESPNNVYFILRGEVKLLFPNQAKSFNPIILRRGHLFGELGVLGNKPRLATAMANSPLQLIALNAEVFRDIVAHTPMLRQLLSSMSKVYSFPRFGAVEQYLGTAKDIGRIITNIYKLSDGRTIIATSCVDKTNVSFVTNNINFADVFHYVKEGQRLTLTVAENYLVGINAQGAWDNLPKLCGLLLEKVYINPAKFIEFQETGILDVEDKHLDLVNDVIICECMSLKRSQLQDLINQGVNDVESLSSATGVGMSCHGCIPKILEMLGHKDWFSARLKKVKIYNENTTGYEVSLSYGQFKPMKPGQYIVLQVECDGIWIERPYTLSDLTVGDLSMIIIQKETNGFFTEWLFSNPNELLDVRVSQPQGLFTLHKETSMPALCLANGIGIVPFVTFVKTLMAEKNTKPMHLAYCVPTVSDFILQNELNTMSDSWSSFTVEYHADDMNAVFTREYLKQLLAVFKEKPEIYICGSTAFTQLIENRLKTIPYPPDKIFIEPYNHASTSL